MEIINFILIFLGLIIVYLVFETINLEKLTAELPTIEKFETSVNDAINNKYTFDIDAIRNLSSLSKTILTEGESFNVPANTTYVNDFVINGSVKITNKNEVLLNLLPKYMVVAWANSNIPKGWVICDGRRYILAADGTASTSDTGDKTPDLRGRFILGSGIGRNNNDTENLTERRINEIGGDEKHELKLDEIPEHQHRYMQPTRSGNGTHDMFLPGWFIIDKSRTHTLAIGNSGFTGGNRQENTGSKLDNAPQDYTVPGVFTTTPHNNMPTFYVLMYIMKL